MQFFMKSHPDYEVVRANILNRENYPNMDSILSELLRRETRMITQVILEGQKKLNLFLGQLGVEIVHILVIFQRYMP